MHPNQVDESFGWAPTTKHTLVKSLTMLESLKLSPSLPLSTYLPCHVELHVLDYSIMSELTITVVRVLPPPKVHVPNLVFDHKQTPIFLWCMVGCESKIRDQKNHVLNRDWRM